VWFWALDSLLLLLHAYTYKAMDVCVSRKIDDTGLSGDLSPTICQDATMLFSLSGFPCPG
jgi:hypothetical protein